MDDVVRRGSAVLSLLLVAVSAGCSSVSGEDVVFESVTSEPRPCPGGAPAEADCFTVVAPVVGVGEGRGRCVVYAAGDSGNLFVAASMDGIEMKPGDTVRWDVTLSRPDDPGFQTWNPVCQPTMEG